jgi:uncharacterized Zn finger protein (UPF0148 family)
MKMNKRKYIYSFLGIVLICVLLGSCRNKNEEHLHGPKHTQETKSEIIYFTCGMHPSIKVSPDEYKKGNTQCPICHMDLVPVYEEKKAAVDTQEVRSVKLTQREILLSGIKTEKVKTLHLFKEIRTVGTVAYDPSLRTAEEEYIQALNTYEKITESKYEDARKRAKEILSAAELKLELLGLTKEWINELRQSRKPHNSLILPAKRMWVYADIYDYESIWPKLNDRVEVASQADPSIIFKGSIKAVDPVINNKTRTTRVKVLVENRNNILKPNMYVDVYLNIDKGKELAIPRDAVLDTGVRKIVYVDVGEGEYILREVKIGPEAMTIINGSKKRYYPVVEGIAQGEKVVIKANFLIDSQSQLTGPAAAAYGGAIDKEGDEKEDVPRHMH